MKILNKSEISFNERDAIKKKVEEYQAGFIALVANMAKATEIVVVFRKEVHAMEDTLDGLRATVPEILAANKAKFDDDAFFANTLFVSALVIVALVVSIVLLLLLKNILRQLGADPSVVKDVAEFISAGDLTMDMSNVDAKSRIGIYGSMISMQERLVDVITQIQENASQISGASTQVSDTATALSQAAASQIGSLTSLAALKERYYRDYNI